MVFIGSATSFGVGVLGPHLLRPWIGDLPQSLNAGALGTLCSTAFLIGLIAVTLIERIASGRQVGGGNGNEDPQ